MRLPVGTEPNLALIFVYIDANIVHTLVFEEIRARRVLRTASCPASLAGPTVLNAVPIDDDNSMRFAIQYNPDRPFTADERQSISARNMLMDPIGPADDPWQVAVEAGETAQRGERLLV